MKTLKEKLGSRIKYLRKELGLSQSKLSELTGLDIPNLSNIECGKRFMTADTLEKLAKALKTTERELFDFSKTEPERYLHSDIKNLLTNFEEKDLIFVLDVLKSYEKVKNSVV